MKFEGLQRIKRLFEPLRPIYDAWMKVIAAFSWLLTRVVLTILFFTVFLLYGILLRALGKDPLSRRLSPEVNTYWGDNVTENSGMEEFDHLY